MIKERVLRLIDRRTVVAVFVVVLLFALSLRGEKIALSAIDGMVYVALGITAGNSAQTAFKAFATRGKSKVKKESSAKE